MASRLIQIFSVILLPIVAIYLSSRRQAAIAWDFLQYECLEHIYVVIVLVLLSAFIFLFSSRVVILDRLSGYIMGSFQTYKWLWMIVAITISASFIPYFSYRYKIYSQISFQRNALAAIDQEDYIKARSICRSYLTLYPQRTKHGGIPDDICVPYLHFFSRMNALYSYLSTYNGTKKTIDGLEIPVDWNAKKYALHLVGKWKGIDERASELSTKQIPIAIPATLTDWAEGASTEDRPTPFSGQGKAAGRLDRPSQDSCNFSVQAGAFSDVSNAVKLSERLSFSTGRDVVLESTEVREMILTRVIIPCLSTMEEAKAVAEKIEIGNTEIRKE